MYSFGWQTTRRGALVEMTIAKLSTKSRDPTTVAVLWRGWNAKTPVHWVEEPQVAKINQKSPTTACLVTRPWFWHVKPQPRRLSQEARRFYQPRRLSLQEARPLRQACRSWQRIVGIEVPWKLLFCYAEQSCAYLVSMQGLKEPVLWYFPLYIHMHKYIRRDSHRPNSTLQPSSHAKHGKVGRVRDGWVSGTFE